MARRCLACGDLIADAGLVALNGSLVALNGCFMAASSWLQFDLMAASWRCHGGLMVVLVLVCLSVR